MALTATATQGFEIWADTKENHVLWVPGDPGDTFTEGNQVVATVGEGVLDPAAANEGGNVGTVQKTVVCAAASTAMPVPDTVDVADGSDLTLIPIQTGVPSGIPIYKVTFANHWDDTVISYTASTRALALTTGMTADNYPNGGLLYVYEGTGAGQVNVVEDYDHADGAAELLLICHRAFDTALDSTSKIIVLGGEAVASRGVGFFNRCELGAAGSLTVNQGSDDGDYVVFMDFRQSADFLKNLTLPVISARYLMLA